MDLGAPPLAQRTPWLRRETVESIAQEGTRCIVRADDGELIRFALPGGGWARMRSAIAELKFTGRDRPVRPAPAAESEVMAAIKAHYRSFQGPEKQFLPKALVSRHPRAVAREVLENFRSARSRLLEAGATRRSAKAIEQAARQVVPPGIADREHHVKRITDQAVRFASLRWTDDFIYDRIPTERIRVLVTDLARTLPPEPIA
jgi:hypothetical protein